MLTGVTSAFDLALAGMIYRSLFTACSLAIAAVTAAAEPVGARLAIGSPAPPLDVEYWLNASMDAEPVSFEPGRVYVIEFWATWCGSCVRRMPRIAELQAEYADKGVTVVSVTDEQPAIATAFLKRPLPGAEGEKPRTYADLTSRYRLAADPDHSTHEAYLEASFLGSLATTYIVGNTGLLEWVGDAGAIDKPLARIVAGEWDREAFATEFAQTQKRSLAYAAFYSKLRTGDFDAIESRLDELASSGDAELARFAKQIQPEVRGTWFFMAATNDLEATIDQLPKALKKQAGDKAAREGLNKQVRIAINLGVLEEPEDLRRVAAALESVDNGHDDETRRTIEALRQAAEPQAPRPAPTSP